jgi:multiple sugar transport system permease protein
MTTFQVVVDAGARPRPLQRRARRREGAFGYLMIALAFAFILVFTLLPIAASLGLSFFSWDIISPPRYVGLQNYRHLLADGHVVNSFRVTLVLAVSIVVLQLVIGMALALLVQQRTRAWVRTTFRTIYYLPLLASTAAASVFMGYMFNEKFGVVNYYLGRLGVPGIPWLTSTLGASATIVMVAVWQSVGFTFVLFVAALSSLPRDVMEAVALDGAGPLRTFFAVKLPLISPTVFFAAVVDFIGAFQLFDQPFIMTSGGPGTATTTTTMIIYQSAFQNLQFGYGSAISMVLFAVLIAITAIQFIAARKLVFYS